MELLKEFLSQSADLYLIFDKIVTRSIKAAFAKWNNVEKMCNNGFLKLHHHLTIEMQNFVHKKKSLYNFNS